MPAFKVKSVQFDLSDMEDMDDDGYNITEEQLQESLQDKALGFGHYEMTINALNREAAIELANLLRSSNTKYLQEIGIELESELMELKD